MAKVGVNLSNPRYLKLPFLELECDRLKIRDGKWAEGGISCLSNPALSDTEENTRGTSCVWSVYVYSVIFAPGELN